MDGYQFHLCEFSEETDLGHVGFKQGWSGVASMPSAKAKVVLFTCNVNNNTSKLNAAAC